MTFMLIPAVYILVRKDNQVLLKRRCNTGYEDGYWSMPAGHIDGGETAAQAAIRELREEVGIEVASPDMKFVHVVHRGGITEKEERVHFGFECRSWEGEPQIMEPHKCDALEWFSMSDLPEKLAPQTKDVIQKIQNGEFYSEYGW